MTLHWYESWLVLKQHPLFGVFCTLLAYQFGLWLNQRLGGFALAHPLLLGLVSVLLIMHFIDYDIHQYQQSTQVMSILLGPVVVALAVPLYANLKYILSLKWLVVGAICVGSFVATISVLLLPAIKGVDQSLLLSLAPKSATTAIAIIVSEKTAGLVALTAVFVALTGVLTVVFAPWVFRLLKIHDERIQGLALGVVGHAVGTVKAFEKGERCGAFSTLAMILTGLLIAVLVPYWVVPTLLPWLSSLK